MSEEARARFGLFVMKMADDANDTSIEEENHNGFIYNVSQDCKQSRC